MATKSNKPSQAKAAGNKPKPAPGKAKTRAKRSAPDAARKRANQATKPQSARKRAKSATRVKTPRANSRVKASRSKATRARGGASKACWWALPVSCLMLMLLGATAFLGVSEYADYQSFKLMRNTVDLDTYYTGILVEGYDVSPLNLTSARDYWETNIEPLFRDRALTLSSGDRTWTINAVELGYTSDYDAVLARAWASGRSGTLEQRYRSVRKTVTSVERFEVTRKLFDEDLLRAWTDGIARVLTFDAVDASVSGFDVNALKFSFSDSQNGSGVDANALFSQARALLLSGGGRHDIQTQTIYPRVSASELSTRYGRITSAVTSASSSTRNRITNLELACKAINGYCVMPGATFSFNDVVGKRTSAKGYKKATVYQSGEVAEDIGGGVCQVSTTLWNAAMKANCSIVERHEHSRPVTYVDKGKDATVDWGSQDMRFKNTSDSPMYLVCYVTTDKKVYCDIYGELFPNGAYITIEAKTTSTIRPDSPTYVPNYLLPSGSSVEITAARTGYRAKAYRVYRNADGSEIKRELLCESHYKMANAVIEYGP